MAPTKPADPASEARDTLIKALLANRTDHKARNAELEKKLVARDARVAELEVELAASNVRISELEALLAKQAEQIEVLTEQLGQNSSNSHLPPSSDGPGAASQGKRGNKSRAAKDKKSKNKRKRGGQKGHRGAHRGLLPLDQVDELIQLFPAACEGCAAALPKTPDSDPRRHQMVELTRTGRHITEWQRNEVQCCCGHRTRAAYDPAKIPASPFGPRLTAVVVMLTGVYHLSRRKTRRLLRELFEIQISLGAISTMEARASEGLVSAVEEAQRAVEGAAVKYADGTSWLLAGVTLSLWTITTTAATIYKVFKDGCRETIRPLFGALIGILVSDRASVFGFWAMALRQICWCHLLRKFVSFSQRDGPAGAIGQELVDYTVLMFEYWHGFKDGQLTRCELAAWMRPLQLQFEATLERAVAAGIVRLSGSCADILKHRQALWTFVTHEGVEPTNNAAELAVRSFVLWRKMSFGANSERGNLFAERIMTVAHTARKQGKDVLEFLVRCVTAHAPGCRCGPCST